MNTSRGLAKADGVNIGAAVFVDAIQKSILGSKKEGIPEYFGGDQHGTMSGWFEEVMSLDEWQGIGKGLRQHHLEKNEDIVASFIEPLVHNLVEILPRVNLKHNSRWWEAWSQRRRLPGIWRCPYVGKCRLSGILQGVRDFPLLYELEECSLLVLRCPFMAL